MPVKFYLIPQPNKAGEYPIRVSISIKYARLMTSFGCSVDEKVWGDGKVIKAKYKNAKGISALQINDRISKISAHFTDYELHLMKDPTVDDLKKEMAIATGEKKPDVKAAPREKNIFDHLQEFIREESINCTWAVGTMQCWAAFSHHIERFSKRLKYSDFDEAGLNRFVRFLRIDEGLEEKTVQKQFNNLKWFLNWAIRKGYCHESQISKFRPKFKVLEKPVIFLTKEELLHLYHFEIPGNGERVTLHTAAGKEYVKIVEDAGGLAKTRDLFCFCAFTSLRYSDMAALKRTDIIGDTMYITTQKTNDRLPINLNKFAKEILDKYAGHTYVGNTALPVISNQKMNKYLKDLCELCGFNTMITKVCFRKGQRVEETYPKYELIGTHAGRRTFICFALSSGVPPQVVMKWTGHSDYKAMKPYIDIAEKTKADAMKLIEDAWDR